MPLEVKIFGAVCWRVSKLLNPGVLERSWKGRDWGNWSASVRCFKAGSVSSAALWRIDYWKTSRKKHRVLTHKTGEISLDANINCKTGVRRGFIEFQIKSLEIYRGITGSPQKQLLMLTQVCYWQSLRSIFRICSPKSPGGRFNEMLRVETRLEKWEVVLRENQNPVQAYAERVLRTIIQERTSSYNHTYGVKS